MLTESFWDWVDVEVVVVAMAAAVVVVVVMVGGSSRGAGTGCTEPTAGAGIAAGTKTGTGIGIGRGRVSLARLPVRMLQRLSEELLRPDWLLASLPRSCWSRYTSWADSVLLCTVTEMRGLDVVRGGTGGGAFLLLTADGRRRKKEHRELRISNLLFVTSDFREKAKVKLNSATRHEPAGAYKVPKHKTINMAYLENKPALYPYCCLYQATSMFL